MVLPVKITGGGGFPPEFHWVGPFISRAGDVFIILAEDSGGGQILRKFLL